MPTTPDGDFARTATMCDNDKDLAYRASPKHVLFSTIVTAGNDTNKNVFKTAHDPARLDTSPKPAETGHEILRPDSYSFDTVPTLIKTPWELQRPVHRSSWPLKGLVEKSSHERTPIRWSWPSLKDSADTPRQEWAVNRHSWSLRVPVEDYGRRSRTDFFSRVPEEICQSILTSLEEIHSASSAICADCLLHDMHSLSLVNNKLHHATSYHMYTNLWLPGNREGLGVNRRNRMKLLLRTLRNRPDLAYKVCRIYAPAMRRDKLSDRKKDAISTDFAEIVLLCPNLQAFKGMYSQLYNGQPLDDLTAALATREGLRQHVWLLEARGAPETVSMSVPVLFRCQMKWSKLETLVIHESNGAVLGPGNVYEVLRQLPALKHLALVGLSHASFHDGTLQALGGLQSLRLEALQGLSDLGLEQPLPKLATTLQSLSLIDLDIKSLRAISTVLSTFTKLQRLTFLQDGPPGLPLGAEIFQATDLPLLHSPSLTYMHWETLVPGSASQALETSIRAAGFPHLRKLRTPCDSDGIFQSLCRPLARRHIAKAEIMAYGKQDAKNDYIRDLNYARTAAQLRTRASGNRSTVVPVSVVVQEEEGKVQYSRVFGRYLGDIASRIEYNLDSDFAGTKEAVGRVEHLIKEEEVDDCYCCNSKGGKRRGGGRHVVKWRREVESLF